MRLIQEMHARTVDVEPGPSLKLTGPSLNLTGPSLNLSGPSLKHTVSAPLSPVVSEDLCVETGGEYWGRCGVRSFSKSHQSFSKSVHVLLYILTRLIDQTGPSLGPGSPLLGLTILLLVLPVFYSYTISVTYSFCTYSLMRGRIKGPRPPVNPIQSDKTFITWAGADLEISKGGVLFIIVVSWSLPTTPTFYCFLGKRGGSSEL